MTVKLNQVLPEGEREREGEGGRERGRGREREKEREFSCCGVVVPDVSPWRGGGGGGGGGGGAGPHLRNRHTTMTDNDLQ